MSIKKEEFYKGAAIYRLIRQGGASLSYEEPFILLNGSQRIWLKYSTACRSPWAFTFTPEERVLLRSAASANVLVIGLVCASDGVAALDFEDFTSVAGETADPVSISCARRHRGRYRVGGPDGLCRARIPATKWQALALGGSCE
ncbi:MAG: hypothetical protein ACRD2E_03220 [Terriglobales bacterium]